MGGRYRYRLAAMLLGGALALSGCGAPQYLYVGSTADNVFFKIPPGWQQISPQTVSLVQQTLLGKQMAGAAGGPLVWSIAFDASAHPSAGHIFSSVTQPVIYASVQVLTPAAQASLSFNRMRDLLYPVTQAAHQAYAAAGVKIPPFRSLGGSVLAAHDGIHGIGELYEYLGRSMPEIFEQIVLTNTQTSKLYLLVIQCDQRCFLAYRDQIATVVRSFTVRGS